MNDQEDVPAGTGKTARAERPATNDRADALAALDWDKGGGLLPAVIQHADSGAVLMLGYMNREALTATRAGGRVTFFSRSKGRLWTKGETSAHFLEVESIACDCDGDALLILARPRGPVCHRGTRTCFGDAPPHASAEPFGFLGSLTQVIRRRIGERPADSYTAQLLEGGTRRIAQKVGEEGVEVALAAVAQSPAALVCESADLLSHLMLLLESTGCSLAAVTDELERRHVARVGPPAGNEPTGSTSPPRASGAPPKPAAG